MKIWVSLYLMIWLALLEFILVLAGPQGLGFLVDVHVLFGAIILALAYYNSVRLRKTDAPARIKRIAKATTTLAAVQPFLGAIPYLNFRMGLEIPLTGIVGFIHVLIAFAIITQAASAATAYDMWEEKEFMIAPHQAQHNRTTARTEIVAGDLRSTTTG